MSFVCKKPISMHKCYRTTSQLCDINDQTFQARFRPITIENERKKSDPNIQKYDLSTG